MRLRGLTVVLWAALALFAAACSGEDDEPRSATPTSSGVEPTTEPTSTGASEQPPATTTTPSAVEAADPAVIAGAASNTVAAGSAKVVTNVRITVPGRGQDRFSGKGAFDFENRVGEMTLRLLEGEGEGAAGSESKAVFADSSVYYQLPPGELPGGKRWIRLDLQNLADASTVDLGPLVQGAQADPSVYLLWLNALGPGVTKIGEEEIRGVPTSRYRAAVDLNLLESRSPPGQEAEWSAYAQTLRDRLGLEFVPVEVWVDGDGLVRRLHHDYGVAADGTTSTVTTELFDFGVAVDAEAPPPGQVAAIDDLIRP